jgi:hypothetical protein
MGRRSRKRGDSTRAERDAARRERALRQQEVGSKPPPRPGRPSLHDRPSAPWGSFPLSELIIFLGIVLILVGAVQGNDGARFIVSGLVIAGLGGGELALREHMAGYRSHSSLLAGVAAFVVVTAVALGLGPVQLWVLVLLGIAVFAATFYAMRELFKRRSGGLGFR